MIASAPVVVMRAGRGAAEVRRLAAGEERDDLADRDLPEQVAEEDEEEQRPEERDEAVGVLLERRAEDLDAQELEDRLEEVPRAAAARRRRAGGTASGRSAASAPPPRRAISIWLRHVERPDVLNRSCGSTWSSGSAAARMHAVMFMSSSSVAYGRVDRARRRGWRDFAACTNAVDQHGQRHPVEREQPVEERACPAGRSARIHDAAQRERREQVERSSRPAPPARRRPASTRATSRGSAATRASDADDERSAPRRASQLARRAASTPSGGERSARIHTHGGQRRSRSARISEHASRIGVRQSLRTSILVHPHRFLDQQVQSRRQAEHRADDHAPRRPAVAAVEPARRRRNPSPTPTAISRPMPR